MVCEEEEEGPGVEAPEASAEEDPRMKTEESTAVRRETSVLLHPERGPASPGSLGNPVSPEREHPERIVRVVPSVIGTEMRTADVTTRSLERWTTVIPEHLAETTTLSDMREDKGRGEATRTTIHHEEAEEAEGAECPSEGPEEHLEVVVVVILTTVTRTTKSTMTTDLAEDLRATTGRDVAPTVVRTEVEARTMGPREKTAQRETALQEDAGSATVVAREIRVMAQERSVQERSVQERNAQERSAQERSAQEMSAQERSAQEKIVRHQESLESAQLQLLRKLKMLDLQILAW